VVDGKNEVKVGEYDRRMTEGRSRVIEYYYGFGSRALLRRLSFPPRGVSKAAIITKISREVVSKATN
jgi:hypothetical protein